MFTILTTVLAAAFVTGSLTHIPAPPESPYATIAAVPVPEGFQRVSLATGEFGAYLRNFPLRTDQETVYLYDGSPKWNQSVHLAILDIEIGSRDLQQCADVVMHLRADFLRKEKRYDEISFDFLNGKKADYKSYCKGDYSEKKFGQYLIYVYSYANTRSLRRQLPQVAVSEMQVGDVFIQAGAPYGHAMIVVDMAQHPRTGKKMFMLAQGFIPAQDAELVVNPKSDSGSPWYDLEFGNVLSTPQWTFYAEDLRRF